MFSFHFLPNDDPPPVLDLLTCCCCGGGGAGASFFGRARSLILTDAPVRVGAAVALAVEARVCRGGRGVGLDTNAPATKTGG